MKLFITLEIKEIDSGGPRGEELDQMVQDAIEELDFDEYEVSNVKIERRKQPLFPTGTSDHLMIISRALSDHGQARRFLKRIAKMILDGGNPGNIEEIELENGQRPY